MIRERIPWQPRRDGLAWNVMPGGLVTLPRFADSWTRFPFYSERLGGAVGPGLALALAQQELHAEAEPRPGPGAALGAEGERFTAVIYAGQLGPPPRSQQPGAPVPPAPQAAYTPAPALTKLLRNVGRSAHVSRVGNATLRLTRFSDKILCYCVFSLFPFEFVTHICMFPGRGAVVWRPAAAAPDTLADLAWPPHAQRAAPSDGRSDHSRLVAS